VGIKTGAAARYVVLPGLLPRIGALFFSGFDSIPYLMAVVYGIIGLLPRNHEYLRPNSYGTYGIRHVVAAAARELKFEWKYIDRIVLFAVMLVAIVMMAMYLVTLLGYVVFSPAFAGGIFMPDYFVTPYPDKDVAFMMLDRVLGIPGLYDSEVSYDVATYGPFPNPFQVGLQAMFAFYSMGLFLISVFIFLVYVLEAVFEVTQTGKPVVELFQDSWMPFRLVAALGLLIPISFGLNSAQWIVLYSAKLGSGLATNAWYEYNNMTGDNPAGLENKELIARPSTPDTVRLIKDLLLIRACIATRSFEAAFGANGTLEAQDYVVTDNDSKRLLTPTGGAGVLGAENFRPIPQTNGVWGGCLLMRPFLLRGLWLGPTNFLMPWLFQGAGIFDWFSGTKTKAEPIFIKMITRAALFLCVAKLSFRLRGLDWGRYFYGRRLSLFRCLYGFWIKP
jgi:hypothetical protein